MQEKKSQRMLVEHNILTRSSWQQKMVKSGTSRMERMQHRS